MRTVIGTLNGQLRPVIVRDRRVEATEKTAEKAGRSNPGHVPAPVQPVEGGDPLLVVS